MDGHDLLHSEIFSQYELDIIKGEVNRRIMIHPFMDGNQTRENIIQLTFTTTLNVVKECLIRKGLEITRKEVEKDGE